MRDEPAAGRETANDVAPVAAWNVRPSRSLMELRHAATDRLTHHQTLRASGWSGDVRPTFRPDAVVNLDAPNWRTSIDTLSEVSGISVESYPRFIQALEQRRAFFKAMGAKATDHAAVTPYTAELSAAEADSFTARDGRTWRQP